MSIAKSILENEVGLDETLKKIRMLSLNHRVNEFDKHITEYRFMDGSEIHFCSKRNKALGLWDDGSELKRFNKWL